MSDLAALIAANKAGDPNEHIIADCLEDVGGAVTCPECYCSKCSGEGCSPYGVAANGPCRVNQNCPTCSGTGTIRAIDYRLRYAKRLILSHPDQDCHRLEYAELLERDAGEVVCPRCNGTKFADAFMYASPGNEPLRKTPIGKQPCHRCEKERGDGEPTGRVSDGTREYAEFIRVQVALASVMQHRPGHNGGTATGMRDPMEVWREQLRELRRRERDLFAAHGGEWFGPTACLTTQHERIDEGGEFRVPRRGFIDSLTLSAADAPRVLEAAYWHPDQRVTCFCNGRKWDQPKPCHRCNGTHGQPRPFVHTAHPITRVRLTTWLGETPGWSLGVGAIWSNENNTEHIFPRWPTITFEVPS